MILQFIHLATIKTFVGDFGMVMTLVNFKLLGYHEL